MSSMPYIMIIFNRGHNPQAPTCDATREGVAHGHCGKGRRGSAEGSDDRRGASEWSDGGGMAVVAVVGTLRDG